MVRGKGDTGGYFIAGDALRGVASLLVLVFHAYVFTSLGHATTYGDFGRVVVQFNAGVYMFFALSGYLVGGPFVRAWLHGGEWPAFLRYAGRRLRRIVPGFWVVAAATLIWFGAKGSSATQILAIFGFAQNFKGGPADAQIVQAWTLGIEMCFYFALPLVALVASVGGRPRSARVRAALFYVPLVLVTMASLKLRADATDDLHSSTNLASMGWAFAPGLALAALEDPLRALLGRLRVARAVPWVLLAGAAAGLAFLVHDQAAVRSWGVNLAYLAIGGGVIGAALTYQWTTRRAPRVLDNRVMHALGRWSYGIYLLHVAVVIELTGHIPSGLGANGALAFMTVAAAAITIPAAALLWWLVEEPAIRRRLPRPARLRPALARTG